MNLFVFGAGYTASAFLRHYGADYDRIVATTRRSAADVPGKAEPLVFDGMTATAAVLAPLAKADCLLASVPPDESGDPVLAHFSLAIANAPKLSRIVYLSTVGVYGDHGGAWIDETTALKPQSARSVARVAAERRWLAIGGASGKTVHILRLSGIYGPQRNGLENLRAGTARRIIKPGQVFNRIHVEDISSAIAASFAHTPSGVWNVTDNEPAPPQDVVTFAANLLGMTPPPDLDFATTPMSAMARSFYSENKRVANTRMIQALGVKLAYPTYREGLRALARDFTDL